MGNIDQLIKKSYESPSGYRDVNPATFTDAVKDRKTKETLEALISRNNFIYLPYIGSKESTRLQLDIKFRRKGLWIGYITNDKKIVVEYYNNDNIEDNYWKDDLYWLPYSEALNISLNEEDLTYTNRGIEFANRDDTQGMGKIIIRRGKPILEQFSQANTIYEICYDFNLGGKTLEVPDDCILDFKGGSIYNGKIIGNSKNKEFKISNFGKDIVSAFNNIKEFNIDYIKIDIDYDINISSPIYVNRSNIEITSNSKIESVGNLFAFDDISVKNIKIKNINGSINSGSLLSINRGITTIYDIDKVEVSGCNITFNNTQYSPVLILGKVTNLLIENNSFVNNEIISNDFDSGILITLRDAPIYDANITISNNYIEGFYYAVNNYSTGALDNCKIHNNTIINCTGGIRTYHMYNCIITNNYFKGCINGAYIWQVSICSENSFISCGPIVLESNIGIFCSNIIKNGIEDGLLLASVNFGRIDNNLISECAGHGIHIRAGGGVYSGGIISANITNNKIYKIQKHGIYLNSEVTPRDLYIINNIIIGCALESNEYNLINTTRTTTRIVINGNILANNDAYYGVTNSNVVNLISLPSVLIGTITNNTFIGANALVVTGISTFLKFAFNTLVGTTVNIGITSDKFINNYNV